MDSLLASSGTSAGLHGEKEISVSSLLCTFHLLICTFTSLTLDQVLGEKNEPDSEVR